MDVARLNFSHGSHEEHAAYIQTIRQVAQDLDLPVAIMQDLPGPKIRTGSLSQKEVLLREGADFILTTREVPGDEHRVSVSIPSLAHDVKPGDAIFLNDGAIKLKVVGIDDADVRCKVIIGGMLGVGKGVNIPGVTLSVPSVTDEDLEHLLFGLEHGVDFVALSFIREAGDILKVREFLKEQKAELPLIAKIEKHESLKRVEQILGVADGIMVARGDLGIEIPIQKVPVAQKDIVKKCNSAGKPVIVATQMLESMVKASHPTRAEVADVANAIFDGADAIMLSAETAVGRYPVEAARMMARIAIEADAALPYELMLLEKGRHIIPQTDDAISYGACHTARQLGASAIVAFTSSGSTARRVAKYRPEVPILAITPSSVTRRRLALSWGVYSCQVAEPSSVDELFAQGGRLAMETGVADSGDLIVITGGLPIGVPGTTNLLKVETIGFRSKMEV